MRSASEVDNPPIIDMAWKKSAITDGEIDALKQAAQRAWGEDTCYPAWIGSSRMGGGQCYVTSCWLVDRLGGSVGVREGHYCWLSGCGTFALDLTGHHTGKAFYEQNPGYESLGLVRDARTERFIRRANRIFDNLDSLLRVADLTGVDAFPAEEPQRKEDLNQLRHPQPENYLHDEPGYEAPTGEYKFIYANGNLEISPSSIFDHNDLAEHIGVPGDHTGPMATGHITVTNGNATWEVESNVNLNSLARIFKDYTKHVGWKWGGLTNVDGEPISDDFAPKKSSLLRFVYAQDHLYLGRCPHSELYLQAGESEGLGGWLQLRGRHAYVSPVVPSVIPSLYEWAEDGGLTLYAGPGMDNTLYRIEDLEQENIYSPKMEQNERAFFPRGDENERSPAGLYQCPSCDRLFPNWALFQRHRKEDAHNEGEPEEHGGFPKVDMDATFPTHFTEQQPYIMPMASYREAARVPGFSKYARIFEFDNDEHLHYVAFLNGSPVGYLTVHPEKKIVRMVEAALKRHGVGSALMLKAQQHFPALRTKASYDWEGQWLQRLGWVHVGNQEWKWAAGTNPKDAIEAPIPFIYDVEHDDVTVGQQGQRTSDIPGRFTPGGIMEGIYEPGGRVTLTTMTNMPVTVRHLVDLWYYQHPELEVKGVYLQDDSGGQTKLADANDVGQTITAMVAADPAVSAAAKALMSAGGHVYAVGGAVRDAVRGQAPKDIDLLVRNLDHDKVAQALAGLPGRVDYTGKDFGVYRYRSKGQEVEVALPRTERSTGPGHKDFEVNSDPGMSIEQDLERRDFTVNAMAVDLTNGKLIDPYNGVDDLRNGRLRTTYEKSLKDDPLRIVRGLTAHGRFGLHPDEDTKGQMAANAENLMHLPADRISPELDKLFGSDNPAAAIKLAHETGVLKHILPEVEQTFGYNQNNPHHELELGHHLLSVLKRTAEQSDDPDLRLAALLHDIGKPASAWADPETGKNHYYRGPNGEGADHEAVGAEMTRDLMRRLRYSNERTRRVSDLIQNHMWDAFTSPRGARRFLNRVEPHADDLLTLRWADQGGKSEYPTDPNLSLDTQRNLIERVRNEQEPTTQAQLAINGSDLIAAGIPQGPRIGQILQQLTDQVLDDPQLNNRDTLLTLAKEHANLP